MAANVETMFYTREKPWHGLGTKVMEAPTSEDALNLAGLNWNVIQQPICTNFEETIPGYKANIRDCDGKVLGVVGDRYQVLQNREAFAFTDELLGEGVKYETAGSLKEGRQVWLLARLPREYIISGERISPYLVFTNTFDGSGAVRVAITPIRVVCNNTLNLALKTATRSFSMIHSGNIKDKIEEAHNTLFRAENYMDKLAVEFERLRDIKVSDSDVKDYIEMLIPLDEDASDIQKRNVSRLRNNLSRRYFDAPDLKSVGDNAYRLINAVSDFATHSEPIRRTKNFNENLFMKTIEGNPMIDRAYQLVAA